MDPISSASVRTQRAKAGVDVSISEKLTVSFMSEMLKHAGVGEARDALGGGPGEDAFAGLLRTEHARALVASGDVDIAERLFEALKSRG